VHPLKPFSPQDQYVSRQRQTCWHARASLQLYFATTDTVREEKSEREKRHTAQRLIHTQTQREKRARARLARERARKNQSQRVIQTHVTDTNTHKLTRCHQRACSETLGQPTSCFLRVCVCVFLLCDCLLRVHQKMRAARSVSPKCVCVCLCACVCVSAVCHFCIFASGQYGECFLGRSYDVHKHIL